MIPLLAIISSLTSLYVFVGLLTRARIFSVTYGLGMFANGVLALLGMYGTSDDALSGVSNVILAIMIVEAAATAGNLGWEYCLEAEAKESVPAVDLEMALVDRGDLVSATTVRSVSVTASGKVAAPKPSAPVVLDVDLSPPVSPRARARGVTGATSNTTKPNTDRKVSAPAQPKVKPTVVHDFEL